MLYKVRVQFHSSARGHPVFLAQFAEETVLFLLYAIGIFVANHLTMYVTIYLWALYPIPLVYMSIFMPGPHCFVYCSSVICFKIRMCDSTNFVIFQNCFACSFK